MYFLIILFINYCTAKTGFINTNVSVNLGDIFNTGNINRIYIRKRYPNATSIPHKFSSGENPIINKLNQSITIVNVQMLDSGNYEFCQEWNSFDGSIYYSAHSFVLNIIPFKCTNHYFGRNSTVEYYFISCASSNGIGEWIINNSCNTMHTILDPYVNNGIIIHTLYVTFIDIYDCIGNFSFKFMVNNVFHVSNIFKLNITVNDTENINDIKCDDKLVFNGYGLWDKLITNMTTVNNSKKVFVKCPYALFNEIYKVSI